MVVRDPHIRVNIGNRLFQMRAYPLTDPTQVARARQAFLSKYEDVRKREALPESQRAKLYFFRLETGWMEHVAKVTAESLYEAGALALQQFRRAEWSREGLDEGTVAAKNRVGVEFELT